MRGDSEEYTRFVRAIAVGRIDVVVRTEFTYNVDGRRQWKQDL